MEHGWKFFRSFALACALLIQSGVGMAGFEPMIDEASLNRAIDPCTDFYSFACGGWETKVVLPEDEASWNRSFSTIHEQNLKQLRTILEAYALGDYSLPSQYSKKLGGFYSSCMNEKSAEEATHSLLPQELAAIDQIGEDKTLTEGIADLQLKGIPVLFSIDSNPDWKNSSQMIAVIDQGGLGLPNRDYYFDTHPEKIKIRKQYQAHIAKMLELSGTLPKLAVEQSKDILSFETELARHALSPQDRRDPDKRYHPTQKKELESWAPSLSWETLFKTLEMGGIPQLNVAEPDFIRAMGQLILKTPLSKIKQYLRWRFLSQTSSTLGKHLVDEDFHFYNQILSGQREQKPRWKRCISATDGLLRDALGEAFIKKTFGKEGKDQSLEILKNIQSTFEENLSKVVWMDDSTRKFAIQKLNNIQNKIGYPDKWTDLSKLEIGNQSYFKNSLSGSRFWRLRDFNKVGKAVDRTEWFMTPPQVNAYYSPEQNEIVFPAGILQSPFFSIASNPAANYGAIGLVIGHELTHGFDDEGRKYDSVGNLQDWWSPQVKEVFSKKAQCIADQYSKYTVAGGTPINGKLTLGENIADLGGLKLAYSAYQKTQAGAKKSEKVAGFTENQQFFVSFAQSWCSKRRPEFEKLRAATDPHAPPRYRVNGVVVNTPEFSQAFHCRADSLMNSPNRCMIW